jgi:arginyl-tRNA synthetase
MSLITDLSEHFGDAFEKLGADRSLGTVTVSDRPDLAQFQCNGAMAAAKELGRAPRDIAQEVIEIGADERYAALTVAGPGFINIDLTDEYLAGCVEALGERFGQEKTDSAARVLVDFGGPNVAKAMHVGHLRTALIGDALQRIFRFAGYDTVSDIHFGDWGTQMGQLLMGAKARRPDLPYFDPDHTGPYPEAPPFTLEDLQEIYPDAAEQARIDPKAHAAAQTATLELQQGRPGYLALWQHFWDVSHNSQKADYDRLGIEFDLWHGESTVHDRVALLIDRMVADGTAREDEAALIVEVAEPGDNKEIPPLLLTKADGAYLYSTTDLATLEDRVEMGVTECLYVVDARQALHFEQLFRAARKAGVVPKSMHLEHVPFGTINDKDGKPFKTRAGGVVRLGDVIELVEAAARDRIAEAELAKGYPPHEQAEIARLVGLAALKYGDLQNHRTSDYTFDLDRFASFEGKTGPYLLYGAVRIKSILRNAGEHGISAGAFIAPTRDSERALMLELLRFPEIIERVLEFRAPNHLAEYCYDVVTAFSRFYEQCHILSEPDSARRASWLRLVEKTLALLLLCLDLLGIQAPERM